MRHRYIVALEYDPNRVFTKYYFPELGYHFPQHGSTIAYHPSSFTTENIMYQAKSLASNFLAGLRKEGKPFPKIIPFDELWELYAVPKKGSRYTLILKELWISDEEIEKAFPYMKNDPQQPTAYTERF